jgi:hypothetical protein
MEVPLVKASAMLPRSMPPTATALTPNPTESPYKLSAPDMRLDGAGMPA